MSNIEAGKTSAGGLRRELKLLDATMLVVGSMIGSGVFIVSADIARNVGSGGWLMVTWMVSAIVTVIAAASYGELAGMFPQAGGQYVYLREAFNPLVAFLYGWTLFLVIQTGSIAAVGVAFAKFTSVIIPWFGEEHVLLEIAGQGISAAQLLAIASILLLTWVNTRGLRQGKLIQDSFTFAKITAVTGLIFLGLFVARNGVAVQANFTDFWSASRTTAESGTVVVRMLSGTSLLAGLVIASVGSLFAFDAWNSSTFTAGETVQPQRTVARSLVLGTGLVAVIYLLANLAYLCVLPLKGTPDGTDALSRGIQFATHDRVGTAAASLIFGEAAAAIMAVLIMISTFGCNNGMILTAARVYYTMARDGLFFRSVGNLNQQGVPATALVLQGIWASVLCLSGKYGDLLDYVVFSVLLFYILTILGIFVLRVKRPEIIRPYKAFGYPVVPALYVVIAAAICLVLLVHKPLYTWPGLAIVLLGVPVFFFWRRSSVHAPR